MTRINIKQSLLATVLVAGIGLTTGIAINDNQTNIQPTTTMNSAITKAARPEDKLVIWSPWTQNGVQDTALREIVDVYNEKGPGSKGAMQVEVKTVTGGYAAVVSNIQQDLKAGNFADLPDMYIGYSDATASLIEFGQASSQHRSFALNVNDKLSNDQIIQSMLDQNNQIAGGVDGEVYAIPFATSSEVMGIDAPLITWMLQQYIKLGGTVTVEGDSVVLRQILDAADSYKDGSLTKHDAGTDNYASSGDAVYAPLTQGGSGTEVAIDQSVIEGVELTASDVTGIETYWASTGADLSGSTLKIDDNTFASVDGIVEFSNEMLKAVKDANKQLSHDSAQAIFGYDAVANDIYTLGQSLTYPNSDHISDLLWKDGNKAQFGMLEQDSLGWQYASEIFDTFGNAFKSGAAWMPNGGHAYGSDLIKNHQLPISIGSTAGATYYFDAKNPEIVNAGDIVYSQAPGKLHKDGVRNVQMQQGPSFGAVNTGDDKRSEGTKEFMSYLVDPTEYEFDTGISSTYITFDNFNDVKDQVPALAAETLPLADTDMDSAHKHFADISKADGTYTDSYGSEWGYYKFAGTNEYVFADGFYGAEVFTFDGTTPGKAVSVTSTTSTDTISPSVFMSSESNYIVGTKAVFEDADYKTKMEDATNSANGTWDGSGTFVAKYGATNGMNNKGLVGPSVAYANILASEDTATTGVELELEPYSTTTSQFRSELTSEVKTMKEAAINGQDVPTSEDLLIDLHNTAVKNGWFAGKTILVWEWWMTLLIVLAVLTVVGGIAVLAWWLITKNNSKNSI